MPGRPSALDRLRVFAVEDDAVQVTWGRLRDGTTHLRLGNDERDVRDRVDGGSSTFTGLAADRDYTVVAAGPGGERAISVRTLPAPPGEELYRFATISDIHIGMDHFDLLHRMKEVPEPDDLHPVRCTRAALRELRAWGAERLVVKGDVTEESMPDEWTEAGELLRSQPVPFDVMPGNHDYEIADGHTTEGRVTTEAGAAFARVAMRRGVEHVDVPGARLVFVETSVPGRHLGTISSTTADLIADAVRDVPVAIVLLHHQLQTAPLPFYWPPGIPLRQTRRFLDALNAASSNVLVTSGHTHRHRRHTAGTAVLTEVGSPKDYPGTWAGYAIYEGGVRQVVRRIESSDCTAWLERTRRAAFHTWGHWSPGRLDDRCFTHVWPTTAA